MAEYRYERKFLIENNCYDSILYNIKLNTGFFREIYKKRRVFSLYFDSLDLTSYKENIEGFENRIKTRLRWYNKNINEINNLQLELKIKKGIVNTKDIFFLSNFNYSGDELINKIIYSSKKTQTNLIRAKLINLLPTLIVSYDRRYYLDIKNKIRITVDNNLNYIFLRKKNIFDKGLYDNKTIIVETKYKVNEEERAKFICNQFPFRLTKSSKYVIGLQNFLN